MSIPASQTPRQPDPLPLKLYATLLEAGSPLLELYLRRRLRAGREDAARFGERHGIPSRPRPDVSVWLVVSDGVSRCAEVSEHPSFHSVPRSLFLRCGRLTC